MVAKIGISGKSRESKWAFVASNVLTFVHGIDVVFEEMLGEKTLWTQWTFGMAT